MPALVFIHDPVAGVTMALNAKDKTGTRTTIRPIPAAVARVDRRAVDRNREWRRADQSSLRPHRGGANDPNFKTESLGTRSFDGVMAEGQRTTMTIPAGQMGNDLPIQIVTEPGLERTASDSAIRNGPTRATARPSPGLRISAARNLHARCSMRRRISK